MAFAFSTLLKTAPKPSPAGCLALKRWSYVYGLARKGRVVQANEVEGVDTDVAWQNANKIESNLPKLPREVPYVRLPSSMLLLSQ
jgi:hypothetical protein